MLTRLVIGFTVLRFTWRAVQHTAFQLVTATANWVSSQSTTQFVVAVTNHSTLTQGSHSPGKLREFYVTSGFFGMIRHIYAGFDTVTAVLRTS